MLSISEKIAAHTSRISELQQKIKDVEHKGTTHHNHFHLIYYSIIICCFIQMLMNHVALVHQMEARLAQIRLQQMELTQLIQYVRWRGGRGGMISLGIS